MFFGLEIIFEKPSLDATFLHSQPDFLGGFSDFENSSWSSQLKSLLSVGDAQATPESNKRSTKWGQI